jgi:asparagine synthase (glutamine-hydrolysing)
MCSISGWYISNCPYGENDLNKCNEAMRHRGPDDWGLFIDNTAGIGLAHNRLSIIDLSKRGHQPMFDQEEEFAIVFNGEIYNFRNLRGELKELGYRFQSETDTEVVLHSYRQWGAACVNRFAGMFAFAIWDSKQQELFLARDPMGIKPLYYWQKTNNSGFVFASEIKAFLQFPDFKPVVNMQALQQFIEFGYTYSSRMTIFAGVRKLLPGHTLLVKSGIHEKSQPYFYPDVSSRNHYDSYQDFEDILYKTLSQVVSEHLIADVPIGLLLSGGLDSSIIAAIAARQCSIKTFSMGFSDSVIDERPFARIASKFIGTDHHEFLITPLEIIDNLHETSGFFDDLFADWGMITTRILYKRCREMGVKVVIVGEGCDELFGGYMTDFLNPSIKNRFPIFWRIFQLYRFYSGRRYGLGVYSFYLMMKSYLRQTQGDFYSAIRLFETRNQLPNNYVMKVDKGSMSVSVEARVPFLDRRIAALAYRSPQHFLLREGTQKWILRLMAKHQNLLPPEIVWRDKFGAAIANSWMDESPIFRGYARDVVMEKNSWTDKLGLREAMYDFFYRDKKGYPLPRAISIFSHIAWRLLILNLWSKIYLR